MCLGEATRRCGVPRGRQQVRCSVPCRGNEETRCASGRQQVRSGVPRRGNEETRCATGRQRGDAVRLEQATGRCGVPRGGNGEVQCGEATG